MAEHLMPANDMQNRLQELEAEVGALRTSRSWRLTRPLRAISELVRRRPAPSGDPGPPEPDPHPAEPSQDSVDAAPAVPAGAFTPQEQGATRFWDDTSTRTFRPRSAFWNDPPTLRHINRIVCGSRLEGQHAGFHQRLAELLQQHGPHPANAISVGCGNGAKEMALLHHGIVGSFDCFDVSAAAIEAGRELAAAQGLGDRMRYHNVNALTADLSGGYDLVYWNSALHHMFDTATAVHWSHARLRPGGIFASDEYVGANRFQHSAAVLEWSNRLLALLPDRLLRPASPDEPPPRRPIGCPDPREVAQEDPSEAVDSANILPSIRLVFPGAEIIPTGGSLYFVALNNAFQNFESEDDLRLLQALLLVDEAVGHLGETQLAVAFAIKGPAPA